MPPLLQNLHNEQRAITPEGMMRYIPFSNLKKTLGYTHNVIKIHRIIFKTIQLRERMMLGVTYERTYVPTGVPTDRGNT